MTTARWERIQALFHAATELPAPERSAFLREECAADTSLHSEVENLLASDVDSEAFLTGAVGDAAAEMFDQKQPMSIGVYSVVRQLGQGGMGTVFLAIRADDHFSKEVAIKLIRAGWQAPEVVKRFRAERQILADLNHPGIARLLDGGTTSAGDPYLVMEYVDGQNISRYCREKQLSIEARLRLFQKACAAVSYAHRHLIVHRDLKPSNILVTDEGEPKLLDFGVAKLLTPEKHQQEVTRWVDWIMTPEYASPEQIRGETITTATDVYSLGVLLYEVLTDSRPFELTGKSATECDRIICDSVPTRPSNAAGVQRRDLSGDLDSIVLKAIRKEPARRYASVDQLSNDIQRYLDGQPVEARPDTWRYRAGKFMGRNRVGVAVACAFAATLAVAMALIVSSQQRAEAAREEAQRDFRNLLAMANSSLFEIDQSIAALPGSTASRSLLLGKVVQHLNLMAREKNSQDPALLRELANGYEKLSGIQFRDGPGYVGDTGGALASAREALRLREQLAAKYSHSADAMAAAEDLNRIGDIERLTGVVGNAAQSYRRSLAILEKLDGVHSSNQQVRRDTGQTYLRLGLAEVNSGDDAHGLADAQNALAIQEKLLADSPSDRTFERDVEQCDIELASMERDFTADHKNMLLHSQRALDIAKQLHSQFPHELQYKVDLASALSGIGHAYRALQDSPKALEFYQQSLAVVRELAATDPSDRRFRRSVGIHSVNAANMLAKIGRLNEAEPLYYQGIKVETSLAAEDTHSRQAQDDLDYSRTALGMLLIKERKFSAAAHQLRASIASREDLVAADPKNTKWRLRLAQTYEALGQTFELSASCAASSDAYRHAIEQLRSLEGKMPIDQELRKVTERPDSCIPSKP